MAGVERRLSEAAGGTRCRDGRVQCDLCPRDCKLHEGQRGLCFVRKMEKRPHGAHHLRPLLGLLRRPGGEEAAQPFLSRHLRSSRSAPRAATSPASSARTGTSPSRARWTGCRTRRAPKRSRRPRCASGCKSVAFTYNDPVIFAEYAMDIADACHAQGVQTVAVTAGYIHAEPRREFYEKMDAANVDLKALHRRVLLQDLRRAPAAGARHAGVPGQGNRGLDRDHHAAHPRQERLRRGDEGRVQVDPRATSGPTCRCISPPSIPTGR